MRTISLIHEATPSQEYSAILDCGNSTPLLMRTKQKRLQMGQLSSMILTMAGPKNPQEAISLSPYRPHAQLFASRALPISLAHPPCAPTIRRRCCAHCCPYLRAGKWILTR